MTHNSYLGSSSHLNENVVNDLAFISGEEENIAQPPQQQIKISMPPKHLIRRENLLFWGMLDYTMDTH